jgi:hypothetical protein
LVTLALLPVVLHRGILRLEPAIDRTFAWLLAASFATLLIFPAAPLGEGGLPRIIAQVAALPLAFAALSGGLGERGLAASLALATPSLFYVHPSSFFVLYPALLFALKDASVRKRWGPLGAAALIGALLCLAPMTSGRINPGQFGMGGAQVDASLGHAVLGNALWDRLKGVFHYLFSDPHGLLKFMSIRSLGVYLGGFVLARHAGRRGLLWILLVPFALSVCSLFPVGIPFGWLRAPGAIFYQSVKRIAEIGLLPLMVIGAAGFGWFQVRFARRSKFLKAMCIALLALWTGVSALRCRATVRQMAELFGTPKVVEVEVLRERLSGIASGSVVVSSQQWFGVIRGIRPDLVFVGAEGECRFSEAPACVGRAKWIR